MQELIFHAFRLGSLPCLHLFKIRPIDAHGTVKALIPAVDGQPVFFRHAFQFFRRDVDLDAAVLVQLHPRIFTDTVFLAIVRNEEPVFFPGSTPSGFNAAKTA